jgi:hypothetical protein
MTASRGGLVKPLAWIGMLCAAVAIGLAVIELVSPPQIGNKIINPSLFQIENALFPIVFFGWVIICFAFYLSGATGSGPLPRIALGLAIAGAFVSSYQNVGSAITLGNFELPDWAGIIQLVFVLAAPLLLGIAALRTRMIPPWQAFYPIIVVAIVSLVFWGIFADSSPSIAITAQALAWIGFGLLAMSVEPAKA